MREFTHIDRAGHVQMVDVSDKKETVRKASALGIVKMKEETFKKIFDHKIKKGNVLETARIAGIMAAKKTSDLIPMCHPLFITNIKIDFFPGKDHKSIAIKSFVQLKGKTGVEIEAITAVSIAGVTIYDMCKSYDRELTIENICLLEKSGGKSGVFKKPMPRDFNLP